jgi:acetyltransferase-like isoleucine patch superfamily enzyme
MSIKLKKLLLRTSYRNKEKEAVRVLMLELQNLNSFQAKFFRKNWNRSLPFADYFIDRWEKAKSLGFGDGSSIYDNSLVIGNVVVGSKTWIGPFCILDGSGGLKVGSNCSISAGVQIYTHDSVKWSISKGNDPYEINSVSIGDNTYIGPNAVITKGVKIGSHCVIGANSFVNKDIPSNTKAWGTPCEIIKISDDNE